MTTPASTYQEDYHRHVWDEYATQITLERFTEDRDGGLKAEITVRTEMPPKPGLLHRGRINLLADRTVKTLANTLHERVVSVDWFAVLTQAFYRSVEHYREGDPLILLHDVQDPGGERWLLEPFLENDGPAVLFAPGDTGKSLLAMCVGLAIASGDPVLGKQPTHTGPVLYLDWEASPIDHHRRLKRFTTDSLPFFYRRQTASLPSSVDAIRRQIIEHDISAVIIDSIGLARGGAPESAEETIRLFAAIRRLGVPALCIDHISKEQMSRKSSDTKMPFGSVYTANSARLVWSAVSSQRDGEIKLHLENTKSNNGPKASPVNVTLTFEGARTVVSYNLNAPKLAGEKTLKTQIADILEGSAGLTAREIANQTGIDADKVRPIVSRSDWFERVVDGKGSTRWVLS